MPSLLSSVRMALPVLLAASALTACDKQPAAPKPPTQSVQAASAPAVVGSVPASAVMQGVSDVRTVPYKAAPAAGKPVPLTAVAELGKKMFFDKTLSGSGKMSCASCHSPQHAYGPPNGLDVQLGGLTLRDQGARAVPSLKYLEHNPSFSIGPNSDVPDSDAVTAPPAPGSDVKVAAVAKGSNGDAAAQAVASANIPQGGLDWDGRVDSFQNQAEGPFLDPHEMANHTMHDVLKALMAAPYANDFKVLFGATVFSNSEMALNEALFALTRYQLEDPSFHPYDSKYDYYLEGKVKLSEQEARGLELFEDSKKGNCSSCHIDKASVDGIFRPAFTDFQFEAFAAPRNMALKANRDPHYYDLGLCGPVRQDLKTIAAYCGLFKTPTLRNAATRKVFFHNGVFHTLNDVLHFYVERETDPARWYPRRANGTIDVYNDLPQQYKKNVDVADAPFDRKAGDAPALNKQEIADIIAFLGTLTDGYQVGAPNADALNAAANTPSMQAALTSATAPGKTSGKSFRH